MKNFLFAAFLAAFVPAALAAPNAVVDAVQYPAWLERGGIAVPLTPGVELQSADKLRTGVNARVQLKLAEGSRVKLGENAQFAIERIEGGSVLRASMAIASGAFRFATDPAAKGERRDVHIQVRNVTAGVRGTDVWGKSTEERDIVCLIEGRVSVASAGQPAVNLESPMDFYQKPRGGSALPVTKVDAKQMAQWSAETEIARDGGAAREGGRWRVIVATFQSRDAAQKMNRALRSEGYPSRIVGEDVPFAVQIAGLASENDARSLIANLRSVPGVCFRASLSEGPAKIFNFMRRGEGNQVGEFDYHRLVPSLARRRRQFAMPSPRARGQPSGARLAAAAGTPAECGAVLNSSNE